MLQGRRKRYVIATIFAVVAIAIALYYAAESNPYKNSRAWNFDSYKANSAPDGFLSNQSDSGGVWVVQPEETAVSKPNVIAQLSGNGTESDYRILIAEDQQGYTQFKASIKFKIIGGEKEQAAGLIIRFQDTRRYFVLVADAANDRFSLCRAEPGKLICTQDVNVDVTTGEWHTITAHVAAQGIGGYLDDRLLVQRYDQHYIGGLIGLWTKGDSKVYFDDLSIVY